MAIYLLWSSRWYFVLHTSTAHFSMFACCMREECSIHDYAVVCVYRDMFECGQWKQENPFETLRAFTARKSRRHVFRCQVAYLRRTQRTTQFNSLTCELSSPSARYPMTSIVWTWIGHVPYSHPMGNTWPLVQQMAQYSYGMLTPESWTQNWKATRLQWRHLTGIERVTLLYPVTSLAKSSCGIRKFYVCIRLDFWIRHCFNMICFVL